MGDFDHLTSKGIGELERAVTRFETYNDGFVLPDTNLIVRLDAHRLGDWGLPHGEYPCGPQATKVFHETAVGLMTTSMRVVCAYHHGDEISLLIDPSENANPLRRSKIISHFASSASVTLMRCSGLAATFSARLSELPSTARVHEYFLWQRRYCYRNALSIALRNALITKGRSFEAAEREIHAVPDVDRLAKLEALGQPFATVTPTTRRGTLFYWDSFSRDGREHFRICSETSLPEDDSAFLELVTRAACLPRFNTANNQASTPPAAPVVRPKQPPTPPSTPRAAAAHKPQKRRPRPNVSVFKMAPGATKPK